MTRTRVRTRSRSSAQPLPARVRLRRRSPSTWAIEGARVGPAMAPTLRGFELLGMNRGVPGIRADRKTGRVEHVMMAFKRSTLATVAIRIGLAMLGVVLVASPEVFGATLTTSAADCQGSAFIIGPTSVSPTTIAPGSTGTIRTEVCSGSATSRILIDLEIYNSGGAKLAQRVFRGQSFSPGETKSYE